jgi:WD40 repeat protein
LEEQAPLATHAEVRSILFSPDSNRLATCDANSASIWELPSGKLVREIGPVQTDVTAVAYSRTKLAFIASSSKSISGIWERPGNNFIV